MATTLCSLVAGSLSVLSEQRERPLATISFLSTAASLTQSYVQHHTFANGQSRVDPLQSVPTFVKLRNAINQCLRLATAALATSTTDSPPGGWREKVVGRGHYALIPEVTKLY